MKRYTGLLPAQLTVCMLIAYSVPAFAAWNMTEQERKKLNDKYDRMNLRYKKSFITDTSEAMLIKPEKENVVNDFTVAKIPPEIKMMIIPDMEPAYFTEDAEHASWANWGKVARSDDNRFFSLSATTVEPAVRSIFTSTAWPVTLCIR